jgi:tetratricopeptide (TPR) repeat protein
MRTACLLVLAALPSVLQAQEPGKRIALIIGNDAYQVSRLQNAVNDARAMDKALTAANFRTTLVENAKRADMDDLLGKFLDSIGPDDTALFFFAGHGVQIENENFLVPVDFVPGNSLSAAKLSCLSVARVFDELKRKRARKNIVILDACRSNPVAARYSLEAGLAEPQNAGRETLIAFSTGPGQVASDNQQGNNSWFTEALSDFISKPTLTLEINDIFTRVRKRVSDATEGKQTPWTTSNLTGAFYFHRPSNADAENDPTLTEKWLEDARRHEQREDWGEAIDVINRILAKKPGGTLEDAAKGRLPYLQARAEAQARFDAGDYAAAAPLFQKAVSLDAFAIDAAMHGVNSLLLQDRVTEAVGLLKAIRVRGASEASRKASEMLKELAAVSPEAGQELKAGVPQPPGVEEIFSGMHFGVPDWDAGKRRLQSAPVDLSRWTRDLKMEVAMPAPIVTLAAPSVAPAEPSIAPGQPPVTAPDIFHIEVIPSAATRDLKLRKPVAEQPLGYVQFDTAGPDTPVLYEGQKSLSGAKLPLTTGDYEVRGVQDGKVLVRQQVVVKPLSTTTITVKPQ